MHARRGDLQGLLPVGPSRDVDEVGRGAGAGSSGGGAGAVAAGRCSRAGSAPQEVRTSARHVGPFTRAPGTSDASAALWAVATRS